MRSTQERCDRSQALIARANELVMSSRTLLEHRRVLMERWRLLIDDRRREIARFRQQQPRPVPRITSAVRVQSARMASRGSMRNERSDGTAAAAPNATNSSPQVIA